VTVNRGALLWAGADLRRRWRGALFLALLAGLGAGVVLAAVVGIRRTDSALDRAIAERRVPVVGLTVSAVVACVALLLLAVVPGMRTARESPSEVLRSE
jgi:hypothetical protein